MGNAGSAPNFQNECIQSELNLCYNQQFLRRTIGETKNKPQTSLGGWLSDRNMADCKVLPKSTENLKLRATTNGAILQAGGTISFRGKELAERKNDPTSFHPMRRCHTLILNGQNDKIPKRKSSPSDSPFRRSQTLLSAGYNKRKSQENVSKKIDNTLQTDPQNISSSSTLKVNKYNKKRKAPPAPISNLSKEDVTSHVQNPLKNTTLVKPRIYTTNNSKAQVTQKQIQSPPIKDRPFQGPSIVQTSVTTFRQVQHTNSSYASKLPYRREKNFDAQLLSQKSSNVSDRGSDRNTSAQTSKEAFSSTHLNKLEFHLDRNAYVGCNEKKKLHRQHGNVATNEDISNSNKVTDHLKERCKLKEENLYLNKIEKKPTFTEYSMATNEKKIKYTQSRIPQLKRTFYFGMDSINKPTRKALAKMNENHKIDAEEKIIDNGILVHVRPTLPRRQLEMPSFSPSAAWRNLLEEPQCLQPEGSNPKQHSSNRRIIETPIYLKSSAKENYPCIKANWTPEQDLDDDDDEELKEVKKADTFSHSLHIFSLSLPRDVHLQCQNHSSMKSTEQENNLKPANCCLVPGFNSLQKLKTQFGKPTDIRSNNKCTCFPNLSDACCSNQHENAFGGSLAMNSKGYHQPHCELNKISSKPTCFQNNNWFLHKSKSKKVISVDTFRTLGNSCLQSSSNSFSFISLQPKSLSNICSGKHIVYLPGQGVLSSSIKDSYEDSNQNNASQLNYKRQRQQNIRENLQDLTPIQNIPQSNVNATEKNSHRFSFQSTVRVLEKRRLAEKLSKDAEMKEAQRLNELEVMKRVEEDFQKKREPEKANVRKQLRLHFKTNAENVEYRSLPLNINEKFNSQYVHNQHISDTNNNIICRAEPDGAVSSSTEVNNVSPKITHSKFLLSSTPKTSKDLGHFLYDGEESEN